MLHIILKILGYVPLFQKGYISGCSQMDLLVVDKSAAGEFYKRKGAVDITSNEGWHHYMLCKEAMESFLLRESTLKYNIKEKAQEDTLHLSANKLKRVLDIKLALLSVYSSWVKARD